MTLLAVPTPREEATRPLRIPDPQRPAATLPLPNHPSPPAARCRRLPSPGPPPGASRAAGRFRLLAPLGSGGMGTVYLAADPRLGRLVAVKMLRRYDPDLGRRLISEARLLARVDHPNVCKVFEAGTTRGRPWVAMQLLAGASLAAAARGMSLRQRVEVTLAVVEGLGAVHRVGLVHRDVKPANVVVEHTAGGWHPYLVDFGLARPRGAQEHTRTGYLMGTPAYLAPEQLRDGAPADHRADLYSAGALLYELLCGAPPFGQGTGAVRRLLTEEPEPLRRRRPDLPAELEAVVLRCLEKEPQRRYPDAAALAADLRRVLAGAPTTARPAGRARRLVHRARRRPRLAAAAGAALAAVALTALAWATGAEGAEQARGANSLERRPAAARGPAAPMVPAGDGVLQEPGGAVGSARGRENYTMVDFFYLDVPGCPSGHGMALNLKSPEVERLVDAVVSRTGESKTEAVRRALEERLDRLSLQVVRRDRREEVMRFLEGEVWPKIPSELLGRGLSRQEQDEILGYRPDGT